MTENKSVDIPMLSVDGQNHIIAELPADVQELISYYQSWETTLKAQRVEAFKTEAAMRSLESEITARVKAMVTARAAKEAADAAEAEKMKADASTALHETLASNDSSAAVLDVSPESAPHDYPHGY